MNKNYKEIRQKIIKNHGSGIALDIDETLSWTIGYWVEQMQRKFGNPENLSVKELIKKYRYTQNVPYWQTEEAMEWMEEHRNSNEIQEMLPLIENANTIIQKISMIIPVVAYLTTRPDTVIEGTKKWLNKHNFPPAEIIARPAKIQIIEGNKWKAGVLEELYPEIIGIIDDNPGLVTQLSASYKGVVYLYDHTEHPRKEINVIACKSWSDVFNKIKLEA